MDVMERRCYNSYLEIDLDKIKRNVEKIRAYTGNEVTLFGTDGRGNRLDGLELGHMLGETRLAMFTHLTDRVERVYVRKG